MTDPINVKLKDAIAVITVDRPDKRNAMDIKTRKRLRTAFEAVVENGSVRVIVLRGAGDESFIAGGDIEEFETYDSVDGLHYLTEHAQGLYNYIARVPFPTIAAVDGYALGGGTEIALACDIRLANKQAKFGLPEVGLGLIPAGGGTQRLAQIVGVGQAKELILTGDVIDADEAYRIGLVNHVYSEEEFESKIQEFATRLSNNAPLAQQLAKKALHQQMDIEKGLNFERIAGAYLFGTEDFSEGVDAFLNNREPEFNQR